MAAPLTPEEALDIVDDWLAQPVVTVVHPGRRHAPVMHAPAEPRRGSAAPPTCDAGTSRCDAAPRATRGVTAPTH